MAYRVQIRPSVNRRIATWGLSDYLFVEVHLRLRESLSQEAPGCLVRVRQPFDGMCYAFSIVDPENRFREHTFIFQVMFTADEEGLLVSQAGYLVRTGI